MSDLRGRIKERLWERFLATCGNQIDAKGYVDCHHPEHNLLPGVRMDQFERELKRGSGNELNQKFCAVHSSSALAVNCFAPFKDKKNRRLLNIGGITDFKHICFEKQLRTGLGGTPPNLDVFLENEECVVGVESKCLEYLTPKAPSSPIVTTRGTNSMSRIRGGTSFRN